MVEIRSASIDPQWGPANGPGAGAKDTRSVTEEFRRARRHSTRVRVLKYVLPVLALLIAAAFAVYAFLLTPGRVSVDLLHSYYSNGKLVMANPKLNGFTRENQPFSMTASRAIQDIDDTNVIKLQEINAVLPLGSDNSASVHADEGTYNRDKNTLDVTSPMTLSTTDGMMAKLQSAFVEIGDGNLKTSDPVDIKLKQSHITANSLTVQDSGKVLVFGNKVHVTIMPGALPAPGKAGKRGDAK